MKRVLVIGASGTIGSAICAELARDTEIVRANYSSGDFRVDLGDVGSIAALFKQVGKLDGVICAAARGVVFKNVGEMRVEDYVNSMQQKLLGQVQVALAAVGVLNDRGSITLTTGVLNRAFVAGGSAAAMVNNGVEGFVRGAAVDMPRGIRINVVSPALLAVSAEKYAAIMPGFETVSSEAVAKAYRRSVYGVQTGEVFCV